MREGHLADRTVAATGVSDAARGREPDYRPLAVGK